MKLVRPIPKRSGPAAGISPQVPTPIMPLATHQGIIGSANGGMQTNMSMGSTSSPMNNFFYLMNNASVTMPSAPGK